MSGESETRISEAEIPTVKSRIRKLKRAGTDAVKKRSRMLRVWAVLVMAMSGGSALLAWMAPPPSGRTRHSSADLAGMARAAIASRTRVAAWRGITVVPQSGSDALQLASVARDPQAHFTITREGEVHAHALWVEQLAADESLEVRVALPSASLEVAGSQLAGLSALLAELRQSATADGTPELLPVHVDPAASPQLSDEIIGLAGQ